MEQREKSGLQVGGAELGQQLLRSFLDTRAQRYSQGLSSPVTAWEACSRLSPYLAWGCVSIRQASHALWFRQAELKELRAAGQETGGWLSSLKAFESRLSWRCHFMQKLEDEPAIEFQNMSPVYDGLREQEFNQDYFHAWCEGLTGYPLVDACMRALRQHSWINFRMRAMLVSFASYHLWLHWRPTAVFLARHFLDYEPGIHFPQMQMQSGTTGINSLRIYSPAKQVRDQDPQGQFIRKFVPELSAVPTEYLAEPHRMPRDLQVRCGCLIGQHYPRPIVEHGAAYRLARQRMTARRKTAEARSDARRVLSKHGSRRRPARGVRPRLPIQPPHRAAPDV